MNMNKALLSLGVLAVIAGGLAFIDFHNSGNLMANILPTPENGSSTVTDTSTTTSSLPVSGPAILVLKPTLYQGDPLYISFSGGTPVSATWNGKQMFVFKFNGSPRAIAPIPPALQPGDYIISARFADGQNITKTIHVYKYNFVVIPTAPFNGTTSPEEEAQLEAEALDFQSSFKSPTPAADFTSAFALPLHIPVSIASPFGEVRQFPDGTQSRHLGTDFSAPVGTPVYAVNSGVVIKVKSYLDYGNVIVIDHGAGIYSVYMHLSRADVKEGQSVSSGEQIGLTGATGFVSGPHLHLSIRIGDFSVDPMRFFPAINQ